jgi:hypothetical protein
MRPVPQCDGNRIRHEWQQPIRLLDGKLRGEAAIKNEHHAIFGRHMRLQERDTPPVNDNIMVTERTREANPDARQGRAVMLLHEPPIRRTAPSGLHRPWSESRFVGSLAPDERLPLTPRMKSSTSLRVGTGISIGLPRLGRVFCVGSAFRLGLFVIRKVA